MDMTFAMVGEYQGDSTESVFLRARYYNPLDGRFVSRDTWNGDYNSPQSLNRWNYTQSNPINSIDPTGLITETEDLDAEKIVKELQIYNISIKIDWGYTIWDSYEPCGWIEGQWTMSDLKAIRDGVRIMDIGVHFLGGNFKSLIGRVTIESRKSEGGTSGATKGLINWRAQDNDSEQYRVYTIVHEMGHIIPYHDKRKMNFFMNQLKTHCSNQPVNSVGYYCNSKQQTGVSYDPGIYAGVNKEFMPSLYALGGSYEDFAETWKWVVTRAYIDSGDAEFAKQAELVYRYRLHGDVIGRRRTVMISIIDGSWKDYSEE